MARTDIKMSHFAGVSALKHCIHHFITSRFKMYVYRKRLFGSPVHPVMYFRGFPGTPNWLQSLTALPVGLAQIDPKEEPVAV